MLYTAYSIGFPGCKIREIPKWIVIKKKREFVIKECNRKELVLLPASHVPAQIMDVWFPSLKVAALALGFMGGVIRLSAFKLL